MEQFAAGAGFRCQGYWLLSRLFLEPPNPALLADLREVQAAAEQSPALQTDIAFLQAAVEAAWADPEPAAVEYTRCLVTLSRGSGEKLPFESHWREGSSPGEATAKLLARMAEWGYGPVLALSAPPDHLGAELRLMALLCNEEREAWQRGDQGSAAQSLGRQHELLGTHLAGWAPGYCLDLAGRAENPYVQAIARLTASVLGDDLALLEEMRREVEAPDPGRP